MKRNETLRQATVPRTSWSRQPKQIKPSEIICKTRFHFYIHLVDYMMYNVDRYAQQNREMQVARVRSLSFLLSVFKTDVPNRTNTYKVLTYAYAYANSLILYNVIHTRLKGDHYL